MLSLCVYYDLYDQIPGRQFAEKEFVGWDLSSNAPKKTSNIILSNGNASLAVGLTALPSLVVATEFARKKSWHLAESNSGLSLEYNIASSLNHLVREEERF